MGFFSEARAFAPSKRVGSLLIVAVAAIVAVIIFRSEASVGGEGPAGVTFVDETTSRPAAEEKDSDSDGLKDWEEELWDLSALNADTDGDGTSDLQEVENRKRAVEDAPALILDNVDPNAPPPSPTALAGQILLSQFLTAKEAGVALPEQSIALASELALQSADLQREYELLSLSDLNITSEPLSARSYGNAIGTALMNTDPASQNEFLVFLAYVQSSDSDKFQEDMAAVIERYDATINGFMTIAVSSDRADEHLALTNALIAVRTDLVDMAKVGDNPIMATAALGTYRTNSSLMTTLFEQLRASLVVSGAEFLPGEPGYTFVHAADTTQ